MSSHCESYRQAIGFLYDLRWFGAKFGLDNTFKLAALAGNPQNRLRFIHVAGTNGKGSTCAILESIYRAAGLRVGLFTSPHLVSFRERIQVNRQLIGEDDVVRLVTELREKCEAGFQPVRTAECGSVSRSGSASDELERIPASPDNRECCGLESRAPTVRQDACPTFFEFVTVMALRYFAEQRCDLVIWETGLGGRLDATNIVTPLASIITNVQFDHQQWLGDTLAKIAHEKAGIIKPGVTVLTAANEPEALEVIAGAARERNAPLVEVGQASNLSRAGRLPALPLLGGHQRLNAALAVAAVETLQKQIPVSDAHIRAGLSRLDWPGRLQWVERSSGQNILLDGAHNVAGAETVRTALKEHFTGLKPTLVLGILRDKDWQRMCVILAPLAPRILTVPVNSERTAAPQELAAQCRAANPTAQVVSCDSLKDALRQTANDSFLTITGSLYLVGEALELLGLLPWNAAYERGLNEWSAAPPAADLALHTKR